MKRLHSLTAIALTGMVGFTSICAPLAARASEEGKRNTAIGLGVAAVVLSQLGHDRDCAPVIIDHRKDCPPVVIEPRFDDHRFDKDRRDDHGRDDHRDNRDNGFRGGDRR